MEESARLVRVGHYDKDGYITILDLVRDIYDSFHAIVYNVGYAIKGGVEKLVEKYKERKS